MGHLGFSGLNARAMFKVPHHPNRPFSFRARRCFQGFGYAFMFIPVSQLAYSYLPKNTNQKGSSLTNLCRKWGWELGIGNGAARITKACW